MLGPYFSTYRRGETTHHIVTNWSPEGVKPGSNRRTPLTPAPPGLNLDFSMSRTPNASKSIFAFVARINLR
jgi:hypothetical protein